MGGWIENLVGGDVGGEVSVLRFEFGVPFSWPACVAFLLAAALGAALFYWPRLSRLAPRMRALLVGLRSAILLLALFLLLDPCIVADRVVPGRRYVALLYDNSQSMQIKGGDDRTRGEAMLHALETRKPEFQEALAKTYRLSLYRFGGDLTPIRASTELDFSDKESDLPGAIKRALAELEGVPVSAVVLFSDGIQQTINPAQNADLLADLPAGIPVFTVGVDTESQWRDLELSDMSVSKTKFDRSPVVVTGSVRGAGMDGTEAVVEVLEQGRPIVTSRVPLSGSAQEGEFRLEFLPVARDLSEFTVNVKPALPTASDSAVTLDDRLPQNNRRSFLVDNREKVHRILYFSGRPNWENKFLRRALDEDRELRLTSLIRISRAEKKFVFRGVRSGSSANPLFEGFEGENGESIRYDEAVLLRLGIEGSELEKGYPALPEDIYPYDLVIWGEIEHDFFSQQQLELTRDYVRKRGGSFLILGGPHSFSEGNYDATIIESMLPVVLASRTPEESIASLKEKFNVDPTLEGLSSGVWTLDVEPDADRLMWDGMPPLSGLNQFAATRPGASVMARARTEAESFKDAPVFAVQRFGEGRTAVLATGATWPWQMQQPIEDSSHERIWRQIIRGLVESVPDPVILRDRRDRYVTGHESRLEFLLRDKLFDPRESLNVQLKIKPPTGSELILPIEESIEEPGVYVATFAPAQTGMHRVTLEALDAKGERVAGFEDALLADADEREFQRAQFNTEFLRLIASRTGGEYLALDEIGKIPGLIPWKSDDQRNEARLHLWRFPGFFALLVIMLAAEWFLRRRKGYA